MSDFIDGLAGEYRETDQARLDRGAAAVARGDCEALSMSCFNLDEVRQLQAYMRRRHPTVTVYWDWLAPQPGGREVSGP